MVTGFLKGADRQNSPLKSCIINYLNNSPVADYRRAADRPFANNVPPELLPAPSWIPAAPIRICEKLLAAIVNSHSLRDRASHSRRNPASPVRPG